MIAPHGAATAVTLRWPVTAWRVRLRVSVPEDLDPFARLILDLSALDRRDPVWIGKMSGLEPEFVRALVATQKGSGSLDSEGRLTDVGQMRRLDQDEEQLRIGWMLRDDLTGTVLPTFFEGDLPFGAWPPGALPLWPEGMKRPPDPEIAARGRFPDALRAMSRLDRGLAIADREDDDVPRTMEEAEAVRAHGRVELLGDGLWDEIAVDVWAELASEGIELRAGCPFGRKADGARYLQRLLANARRYPAVQAALDGLQTIGGQKLEEWHDEQRDLTLVAIRADRKAALTAGRALPDYVQRQLEEAEDMSFRAERGRARADKAILEWGLFAEEVLHHFCPPAGAGPDAAWLARWASTLPERPETAATAALGLVGGLLVDDDGHPLDAPGSARHPEVVVQLLRALLKTERDEASQLLCWRPRATPSWHRKGDKLIGARLLLLPSLAAAMLAQTPGESEAHHRANAWQATLARDPSVWRTIARILDLRNKVGAHTHRLDAATLERMLVDARSSARAVLNAAFPASP
ncbi:MAG: hypothetical protein V4850_17760 [Myxococcota bacterium]